MAKDALYGWRTKHRKSLGDTSVPQVASGELESEEKFAVVIRQRQSQRGKAERVLPT
jgi:hypothetical protein